MVWVRCVVVGVAHECVDSVWIVVWLYVFCEVISIVDVRVNISYSGSVLYGNVFILFLLFTTTRLVAIYSYVVFLNKFCLILLPILIGQ